MKLIEYFAVIDDDGLRQGPFETLDEASHFLHEVASERGYTDEQANEFFSHGSAVVKVETRNGKVVLFNLGWPEREKLVRPKTSPAKRGPLPEMVMAKAPLRGKRK